MKKIRLREGDVFEIPLPSNRYAYCRLYKDATVAIYRYTSKVPDSPPIGARDFLMQIGITESTLKDGEFKRVGTDTFLPGETSWPDATFVKDDITGNFSIYHEGTLRPATRKECKGMSETIVLSGPEVIAKIDKAL